MGPLRRIRSHDDPEVPAHEPKRDVADAPGIPRETRLGRRVEEETCFITDQTVRQALQPSQLNGGNLVDIFQNREDDFEAVETMEVSYTSSSGEKVQELVFAENSKQKTFSGPRILVSASRVNTMHRAISVLSRKVDNLTTTLRVCREHYYKELFSLRHGRQPSEEHEKFWFTPQAYQDTVSIQELRKRFGTEQEDLRKREQEVRELRAKLRQIDSIAEDRLEKLITCKTIPELFNWMRDMNGFREADFDLHLQVLAQEISLKATDANKAPDLEKEKLKSSLEDAEFEVESLQKKLMEAQVANQGLMDLLTERRAEPIVVAPAPIEEEPDLDDDSNPSSVATPVRSKEVAEMSQRRHSQATEDTLTILNRQAQAAAELAEAEEKNRQLQALAFKVFNAIAAKRREAQWNPRLQQLNISGFSDPGVRSVHEEFSMPSVMGLKLSPREMFEFQAAERNSSRYLLTFSSDTDSPIPSFNNSAVKATQCVAAYEVVPDGSAGSRIRMVQHLNANVGMAEHVQFLWEKRVISMLSAWASELSEEARNIVAQRNCGKGGGCPLPGYDSDLLELLSPSPLQRNSSMTIAKVLSLAPKQVSFRRLTTATDSLPHWQRAFGKLPLTTVLNVTQWDSFESRADEVMSLFRLVEHNATDDEKEAFASLAHDALDVQRQGEALASLQWRYLEVINRHDCDASLPDINGNTGNRAWSFAVVVAIAVAIVVLLLSCISCCCVKLYRIRRERQARQAASLLLSAASSCAPSDRAVAPTSEASTTASQGEVLRR